VRYLWLTALISLTFAAPSAAENGRSLYENYCLACHYRDGSPGHGGADLRKPFRHGNDLKSVMRVITYGVPGTQMPGFSDLSENQRRALAKHVLQINRRALSKTK